MTDRRSSFERILPGKSTTFGKKDFLDDDVRNFGPKIKVVNRTQRVLSMWGEAAGAHGFGPGTMKETWCIAAELIIYVDEVPEPKPKRLPLWKRVLRVFTFKEGM